MSLFAKSESIARVAGSRAGGRSHAFVAMETLERDDLVSVRASTVNPMGMAIQCRWRERYRHHNHGHRVRLGMRGPDASVFTGKANHEFF